MFVTKSGIPAILVLSTTKAQTMATEVPSPRATSTVETPQTSLWACRVPTTGPHSTGAWLTYCSASTMTDSTRRRNVKAI